MKFETILSLLLVSAMISVSGSVFATPIAPGNSQVLHFSGSPSVFHGNVTVYTNGTISLPSAPISKSGLHYTLKGDINGSLRFKASDAVLNGNNFSIFGNNGSNPALLISNSSAVSVANLTIISYNFSAAGLLVVNTSKDSIRDINVAAPSIGLVVSNSTFDVNVSYSSVSVGGSHGPAVAAIVTGGYLGANNVLAPASGSRNISLYQNTISNSGGAFGTLINSQNSSLRDSTVTMTGKYTSSNPNTLILADQNNTSIENNVLYATNITFGVVFGNFNLQPSFLYTGEVFNGNTLTINSPAQNHYLGLLSVSTDLTISENHMYAKNMTESTLLYLILGDVNVTDNTISIMNSSDAGVFYSEFTNVTMVSNSILYTQNSPLQSSDVIFVYDSFNFRLNDNSIFANNALSGSALIYVSQGRPSGTANTINGNHLYSNNSSAYGILFSGDNTSISQNTLYLNGSEPNGIVFSGTGLTVFNNSVDIKSGISSAGLGDFFGNVNVGIDGSNISNNTVMITGSASGQIFGMYFIYGGQHLGIKSNYIYSNDSQFKGISFAGGLLGNVSISLNTIIYSPLHAGSFNGLSINAMNTNALLISGNMIHGMGVSGMKQGSYALQIENGRGITVSNNTFEGANTSVSLTFDGNITFYGNYVIDEYKALSFIGVNNAIFYHNDFEQFNVTAFFFASTNLSFNASYPVGGNYWSNYTGVDHNSGPDQNTPGSDGIGDTPYILNATLKDHYPLMKPWTRPMATFTESGLVPGQQWSVSFNGKTVVTTQQVISFPILNATYQGYTYSVETLSGYTGGGQSGIFNYSGNGFTENVTYLAFAHLYIKVLPQNATIVINGHSYGTDNGSFNISLAVGNYSIQFEHSGYNTDSINLTLTAGEIKYVNISLSRVTGANDILYYVIAGIVVAVIGALSFYFVRRRSR